VRPAEKMFEELFFDFETRLNTPATKIFRVQARVEPWAQLQQQLAELRADCATGIADRIRSRVKEIVPQYRWEPKEADVPANLLLR
jgi:FlaA1/EpsC-like NDP-sugar epimerase